MPVRPAQLKYESVPRPPENETHATKLAIFMITKRDPGCPTEEYACAPYPYDQAYSECSFTSKSARKILADKPGWVLPTCKMCCALVVEALSIRALDLARSRGGVVPSEAET